MTLRSHPSTGKKPAVSISAQISRVVIVTAALAVLLTMLAMIVVATLLAQAAVAQRAPTLPVPMPVAKVMTQVERIVAALQAMNFEPVDDGWRLTLPAPLTFSFDSDVVAPAARDSLIIVGRELNELGIDRALVLGHTDNVGSKEYNLALSKRRADAVALVFNEGGYPASRTETKGLADSVPSADNASAEGRAQNRRVVIIVQVK